MTNVKKELVQEKLYRLSRAVEEKYSKYEEDEGDTYITQYAWMKDYDDETGEVYFCVGGMYYKVLLESDDGDNVVLSGVPTEVEVKSTTTYVEKQVEDSESTIVDKVLKKFLSILESKEGQSEAETKGIVLKQFDEEQMIAIEPLYAPPETADADEEGMTREDIEKMVESANKAIKEQRLQAKYYHKKETSDFSFLKAWVSECDCYIGEHFVPEGQPIMKVQFHNKKAWEARKSGELMGLSIGARAETIEEVA